MQKKTINNDHNPILIRHFVASASSFYHTNPQWKLTINLRTFRCSLYYQICLFSKPNKIEIVQSEFFLSFFIWRFFASQGDLLGLRPSPWKSILFSLSPSLFFWKSKTYATWRKIDAYCNQKSHHRLLMRSRNYITINYFYSRLQ